jgi:flagellar FliL protein
MAEAAEEAPVRKPKKKLFLVLAALVVLLGGGGAGAWYFMGNAAPAAAEEAPPKVPVFLPLETFTVNLQGGEQYLQLDITLQLTDPAQSDLIKLHMPRVRSRLLSLLSSKHADELMTAEDKKKLTQDILAQVKLPFDPKGKPQLVDDVLFTSFVIQ